MHVLPCAIRSSCARVDILIFATESTGNPKVAIIMGVVIMAIQDQHAMGILEPQCNRTNLTSCPHLPVIGREGSWIASSWHMHQLSDLESMLAIIIVLQGLFFWSGLQDYWLYNDLCSWAHCVCKWPSSKLIIMETLYSGLQVPCHSAGSSSEADPPSSLI